MQSRHLSISIHRPAAEVYEFVVDPANLPHRAAGPSGSIEQLNERWLVDSPLGRVDVELAPRNEFGVLDHVVTLPDGRRVDNPLRVIGWDGSCELVFTLRQRGDQSDADFESDGAAVLNDLESLKALLETR